MDFPDTAFVHPASSQTGEVSVGEYSSLWPSSSIRGDFNFIKIGKFSSVQDCCVLHATPYYSVTVGDFVTIGHGAVLHACVIEDECVSGMHATVLDGAVIGKGSIVAPGAVVRERGGPRGLSGPSRRPAPAGGHVAAGWRSPAPRR